MNRGTRYLLVYLGLAWFLAGAGDLVVALDERSDVAADEDRAIERVTQGYVAMIEVAEAELEALGDTGATADELKLIKDELAEFVKERDAEVERIKDNRSEDGGGIMTLLGPLLATLLGIGLIAAGKRGGVPSIDLEDGEEDPNEADATEAEYQRQLADHAKAQAEYERLLAAQEAAETEKTEKTEKE